MCDRLFTGRTYQWRSAGQYDPECTSIEMKKTRILILGGGFGGIYAALEIERRCDPQFDVTLISQDNFFLSTAMLHEVACSDLDVTHIVKPIQPMLRHVGFFEGQILSVHTGAQKVTVRHGFEQHSHMLEYDHVVFALGGVTNSYGIPNLAEIAMTMKSLGDAIALRNRLIARLEEADTECAAVDRESLLTFVVAGGGFAGVETFGSSQSSVAKTWFPFDLIHLVCWLPAAAGRGLREC